MALRSCWYLVALSIESLGFAGLRTAKTVPPVSDDCADSIELVGAAVVEGATASAPPDGGEACGSAGEGRHAGVWYQVKGTGICSKRVSALARPSTLRPTSIVEVVDLWFA